MMPSLMSDSNGKQQTMQLQTRQNLPRLQQQVAWDLGSPGFCCAPGWELIEQCVFIIQSDPDCVLTLFQLLDLVLMENSTSSDCYRGDPALP